MKGYINPEKDAKIQEILDKIAEAMPQKKAAESSGVPWRTWYGWKERTPELQDDVVKCLEMAGETIEEEIRRRAIDGVDEPVYQGGKLVGHVKRYSENLLLALARAHMPHRYDRGGAMNMKNLTDAELHEIAGTARVRGAGPAREAAAGIRDGSRGDGVAEPPSVH